MSAFIVNKQTIDAICRFASKHELLGYGVPDTLEELGQLLWDENHRSVNFRYDEKTTTPKYEFSAPPVCFDMSAAQFKKLLHCLDYQSCECDDYEKTRAHYVIRELSFRTDRLVPGYEEAAWGLLK